ncbi:MAG: hypothetical protein K9N49_02130 [Candidatus Marinimicrobia bacterium]|nr:hypothetical protein [Candidatus Neomarinimicrobiota bacterium]
MKTEQRIVLAAIDLEQAETGYAFAGDSALSPRLQAGVLAAWQDPIFHPRWAGATEWSFTPDEGRMALQSIKSGGDAALLTRETGWSDYRISAAVRVLGRLAPAEPGNGRVLVNRSGLIFRFQDMYRYYFLCIEAGRRVVLYRREDMLRFDELGAWEPASGDLLGAYQRLAITGDGPRLECTLNDEPIIAVEDAAFAAGAAGLRAAGFAAYRDILVDAAPPQFTRGQQRMAAAARALQAVREATPQPTLAHTIPLPGAGLAVQFVDLPGHARPCALVICRQPTGAGELLAAVDHEGRILWTHAAQLYWGGTTRLRAWDIDDDGRVELVVVADGLIRILDAATGALRQETPAPPRGLMMERMPEKARPHGQTYGWYFPRLRGPGQPRDILFFDCLPAGGWNLWVYDAQLRLRFQRFNEQPQHGHHAFCFDLNGDGYDEILLGSRLLDCEGRQIWLAPGAKEMDLFGPGRHVDNVSIGRKSDDPRDGYFVVMSAGDDGLFLLDAADGRLIAHHTFGHVQGHSVSTYRRDLPGSQIWAATRHRGYGVLALFDSRGQCLQRGQPDFRNQGGAPCTWTAGGEDLLCLRRSTPEAAGLWDARGRLVAPLPAGIWDPPQGGAADQLGRILPPEPLLGGPLDDIPILAGEQIRIYTRDRPVTMPDRPARPREHNLHSTPVRL